MKVKVKKFFLLPFVFLLFTFLVSSCTFSVASSRQVTPTETEVSLRTLAEKRGILIGAAVDMRALHSDRTYREVLSREFNAVMPENVMKFAAVHPQPNEYNFAKTDTLIAFAQANNMAVRGHPLVWHYDLPKWLEQGNFTRDQLIAILKEHIQTLVSRYRGQVAIWDVVNEAISRDGSFENTIWLRGIGPEYIDLAFRWAREADPEAQLFYNEYSAEEMGQKSDAVYTLVQGMIQRGVPINGVGLQMHKDIDWSAIPSVTENMQRLTDLGLDVSITEMDIYIKDGIKNKEKALAQQARVYGNMLQGCLSISRCRAFVMCGFSDRYTWATSWRGNQGAPLIFDESFRPKPAYYALKEALSN